MELIGSLFLILSVGLVVVIFITRPFLLNQGKWIAAGELSGQSEREHQRSALMAERDRILNALQELDFDYALGKIPQEDYPDQRAVLLHSGAEVLRKLDALTVSAVAAEREAGASASNQPLSVEDRIEAAVAARRADASRPARPVAEVATKSAKNGNGGAKDELEELIASRKRQRNESSAGFCPRCGKPVQKSDRFCSKCGADL